MGKYIAKTKPFSGRLYADIERAARQSYKTIAAQTKRAPYVRSHFFDGQKIFLEPFWQHLNQKPRNDRRRRLLFFNPGIELVKKSGALPISVIDTSKRYRLYRFEGEASNKVFYVQIKEDKKLDQRALLSIFPKK